MFVKICGVTNEEDALMAVAMGADAVGFVFAPSPRQITVTAARDMVRRLPEEIMTVGVFRDQSVRQVISAAQGAGLTAVQLHGHETPEQADEIRPYVQALIVAFSAGDPALAHVDDYGADAILIDSHAPGSGKVFDWSLADGAPSNRRIILAGGLTPENVESGIRQVRPWGVDTASGVETGGPGSRKDPRKVQAFVANARAAGRRLKSEENPSAPTAERPDRPKPFDWSESDM